MEGDSQGVSTRRRLAGPVGVQAEAIGARGLVVGGGGDGERGVIVVVDEEGRDEEGNGNRDGNDVAVRVGGGAGVGEEEVRDVGWEGGEGVWGIGLELKSSVGVKSTFCAFHLMRTVPTRSKSFAFQSCGTIVNVSTVCVGSSKSIMLWKPTKTNHHGNILACSLVFTSTDVLFFQSD